MKFSDLNKKLKDVKKGGEEEKKTGSPATAFQAAPRHRNGATRQKNEQACPAPASEASSELERHSLEAKSIYGKAVHAARELFSGINPPSSREYCTIFELSRSILNLFRNGNEQLLVYASHSTAGNYLYAHTANVAVLSMYLARHLNLSEEDQVQLGCGAFFHDIGMGQLMHLANKETELTRPERVEIQTHPLTGDRLLENVQDIPPKALPRLKQVISQEHERFDASGYPRGLARNDIDLFAQLIGMIDVYEALSHPRNWRERLHPHNAIKHIMNLKGLDFSPQLVKVLVENLSMYPPGSYVRLSTGETARVIGVNPGLLMRPKVEIILDSSGCRATRRPLDLMEHPIISIAGAIDETEIDVKDRRLLVQFEAARWWVDW